MGSHRRSPQNHTNHNVLNHNSPLEEQHAGAFCERCTRSTYITVHLSLPTGVIGLGPQRQVTLIPDQPGCGNMLTKVVADTLRPLPWEGPPGVRIGQVLSECYEER